MQDETPLNPVTKGSLKHSIHLAKAQLKGYNEGHKNGPVKVCHHFPGLTP